MRIGLAKASDKLEAVQAGHAQIGENNFEITLGGQTQADIAVRGDRHEVAFFAKNPT